MTLMEQLKIQMRTSLRLNIQQIVYYIYLKDIAKIHTCTFIEVPSILFFLATCIIICS